MDRAVVVGSWSDGWKERYHSSASSALLKTSNLDTSAEVRFRVERERRGRDEGRRSDSREVRKEAVAACSAEGGRRKDGGGFCLTEGSASEPIESGHEKRTAATSSRTAPTHSSSPPSFALPLPFPSPIPSHRCLKPTNALAASFFKPLLHSFEPFSSSPSISSKSRLSRSRMGMKIPRLARSDDEVGRKADRDLRDVVSESKDGEGEERDCRTRRKERESLRCEWAGPDVDDRVDLMLVPCPAPRMLLINPLVRPNPPPLKLPSESVLSSSKSDESSSSSSSSEVENEPVERYDEDAVPLEDELERRRRRGARCERRGGKKAEGA